MREEGEEDISGQPLSYTAGHGVRVKEKLHRNREW